jgi:hypothetical protein
MRGEDELHGSVLPCMLAKAAEGYRQNKGHPSSPQDLNHISNRASLGFGSARQNGQRRIHSPSGNDEAGAVEGQTRRLQRS